MGGSTDFPGIPDVPHAADGSQPGAPSTSVPPTYTPPPPPAPAPAFGGAAPAFGGPLPDGAVATVPVVPTPPQRKRRTGLLVGVGVVAALAVGGGAFALLGKDDPKPTFSLKASAEAASEVKAFSMTMSIKSEAGDMSIDADVDPVQQLMQLTLDARAMLPGQEGNLVMILDQKNKGMYMASDIFKRMGAPVDTPWILLDEEFMRGSGAGSAFGNLNIDQPLSVAPLFEKASKVQDLGLETFDGEQVKHFVITLPTAEVIKAAPQIKSQLDKTGATLPDEVVYDVYVTEANEIRRLMYTMALGAGVGDGSADVVFKRLDAPPVITVPTESEYTKLNDLL